MQANNEKTSMLSASARCVRGAMLLRNVRSTSCAVSAYLPKIRTTAVPSGDA